jgi:RNA-directed DNA polymerase
MIAKNYDEINWAYSQKKLAVLQHDILEAYKKKDSHRILITQNKLIRSFAARSLAVRKVTSNKGAKTKGIDGVSITTKVDKFKLIKELKNISPSSYEAKPVRKVLIPKTPGKLRPLGIPTILDRVVQTLYYFALDPIAEEQADIRSYGFRKYRSVNDCVIYLKLVLGNYTATRRYVLKCDIKGFFPSVAHAWLLKNIPMNKTILEKFLKAGFVDNHIFNTTEEGFPQGSPISPTLANMALNGLSDCIGEEFRMTRYGDDFVILGKTKEALLNEAYPKIQDFLKIRGLELEKTQVVEISEGFDFLGYHFREFYDPARIKGTKKGIFLVKPSKAKIQEFKKLISKTVRENTKSPMYVLIQILNEKLRGWAEHYRTVTSQKAFSSIHYHVWNTTWAMLRKKHRTRNVKRILEKYYCKRLGNKWILRCEQSDGKSEMTLFQIPYVEMRRHQLCDSGNPYDPENYEYFKRRLSRSARYSILLGRMRSNLLKIQKGKCPVCTNSLLNGEDLEVHHILPRKDGGSDKPKNLLLLHKECHKQVTNSKNENTIAIWRQQGIIK